VIVFVAIGRAARHAQHSEPAGAEESRDQDGGEDQDILLSKVFPAGPGSSTPLSSAL